ncbi:uncharacterized protein FIBRA_03198 [Fibroporia radiculosa]|uniref:DASH complex subunit DUO1 n=1 Tax=Fibroporia radiculosa TaxID=599839 RepID=J4GNC5_9APHY|nr:uncharacterized protein FIBRA_03198 [Fibroporia radiculosa]CCM01150.1 predicted protein [Fibroporia radiculosa]
MDSPNISELNDLHNGSRLLSESSILHNSSSDSLRTGPGGDDLSLSELSLSDRPPPGPPRRPKFSLLARPSQQELDIADESGVSDDVDVDVDVGQEGVFDQTMRQEDIEKTQRTAAKSREERLQHDLFILKKLNSAFETYKDALRETKSSTERVAIQLENTNTLLDKYVNLLTKSENVARLIMDKRWQGAEVDEEILEREQLEAIARARREEEERVLAEQRERERLEREEKERKEREETEKLQRERAEATKSTGRGSGVRGVRGTRASLRGVVPRAAAAASTRGMRGVASAAIKRPASSASTRSASGSGTMRAWTAILPCLLAPPSDKDMTAAKLLTLDEHIVEPAVSPHRVTSTPIHPELKTQVWVVAAVWAGSVQRGDCDSMNYCTSSGICELRGCRRDQFPFGYPSDVTLPPLCGTGRFCPDEEDRCISLLTVGSPCQFNRDDQCIGPPNHRELTDGTGFGLNVNGSVCLNNLSPRWANASVGDACQVQNIAFVAFGRNGINYPDVVSRDNCRVGAYCDSQKLACIRTKNIGVTCSADKECSTYNCLAAGICGPRTDAPVHVSTWVYAVVGAGGCGAIITILASLFFFHKKERDAEREKRIQYWQEQNALRQNLMQMKKTAHDYYPSVPGSRSTLRGSPLVNDSVMFDADQTHPHYGNMQSSGAP